MHKASMLAVVAAAILITTVSSAYATNGGSTGLDISSFGTEIVLGLILGFLTAILGALSSTPVTWSYPKLAYTIILSTLASLSIITTQFGGQVTDQNIIQIILAVLGTGFVANKGLQIHNKLRNLVMIRKQ